MSPGVAISGLQLALFAARGVLLIVVLYLVARAIPLAPLSRKKKELVRATTPACVTAVLLAYSGYGVLKFFGAEPVAAAGLLGLLLLAVVVALWGTIVDVLAGVVIKAARSVHVGDELQLRSLHGRVERLDQRGLWLRTAEGSAYVPYAEFSRAVVVRTVSARAAAAHSFRVRAIAGLSQLELRRIIVESALLCHWSSIVREPELTAVENDALDVRVFSVVPELAVEIEAVVRRKLASLQPARGGPAHRHEPDEARALEPAELAANTNRLGVRE